MELELRGIKCPAPFIIQVSGQAPYRLPVMPLLNPRHLMHVWSNVNWGVT